MDQEEFQKTRYVVHRQFPDGTFEEVAQYFLLEDARATYDKLHAAIIVNAAQEIVDLKNLREYRG